MELFFIIGIISFIVCLFITDRYFKSKDDLMKKAKCKKYISICVIVLGVCILLMSILEFM